MCTRTLVNVIIWSENFKAEILSTKWEEKNNVCDLQEPQRTVKLHLIKTLRNCNVLALLKFSQIPRIKKIPILFWWDVKSLTKYQLSYMWDLSKCELIFCLFCKRNNFNDIHIEPPSIFRNRLLHIEKLFHWIFLYNVFFSKLFFLF